MISFNNFRNKISQEFLSGDWIFRGQANSNWGLTSTYSRYCERHKIEYSVSNFFQMLDKFISLSSNLLNENLSKLGVIHQIALAQHHGLPTPFLDWTYSPYVALYFATSHSLLSLNNCETSVSVWAIRLNGNQVISNNDRDSLIESKFGIVKMNMFTTKRLRRQNGCFTFIRFNNDLSKEHTKLNVDLRKFDIVADHLSLLAELQFMGISSGNLFDDLNGVASDVKLNSILQKTP